MIKAHEIQGVIALENSFNRVGLDHVVLVKVASTAVAAQMLGLPREGVINAVSHAWIDGQSPADLPPRSQHRLAQVLGSGRRDLARGAPRPHRENGRDGLPLGAHREDLGFLRRALPRKAVPLRAALRLLRDGKRALQDFLPRGIPRPDRGRGGAPPASGGEGPAPRDQENRDRHARVGDPHHRQEGAPRTTPPTATTASSTWSRSASSRAT